MSFLEKKSCPANLESLEQLRDYVHVATAKTPLTRIQIYKLKLAIDEIATNVILYGYQGSKIDTEISIEAELKEQSLVIILKDQGVAFDSGSVTLPGKDELLKPLEKRAVGGLGIYLTFTGVDRFAYERQDDVNINSFEVFFNP